MSEHDHDHDHADEGHSHGHAHDRGPKAVLRYLKNAPGMWSSEINENVIDLVDPKPGERVLDIGAGMGPATALAAERGASVVSVEPTPYLRAICSARRLLRSWRSKVEVLDGAAEALPAADGSIDAVWATNTMHHWTDADLAVAEIARVLAPGGRIVLVDEAFDDPSHPDHEKFGRHKKSIEDHGFHHVDAERMAQRLRDVGLVDVDSSREKVGRRPVASVTGRSPEQP